MITVIAGTNRHDSLTLRTATIYYNMLLPLTQDVKLFSLEHHEVFERTQAMLALEQEYLIPAEKFVFIMPEYNASFPGILKLMMDNSDIKKCWWHKKALLVGISDGRAGNIRGIEHMTSILNYLKVNVLYNKVILSGINNEIDHEGNLIKPQTAEMITKQINEFIDF